MPNFAQNEISFKVNDKIAITYLWIVLTVSKYSGGNSVALAGSLMKNVSWASRAGCCWGWNKASKFQKLLST